MTANVVAVSFSYESSRAKSPFRFFAGDFQTMLYSMKAANFAVFLGTGNTPLLMVTQEYKLARDLGELPVACFDILLLLNSDNI